MTVIRLPGDSKIEPWMCPVSGPEEAPICGMLRTKDELSIVLPSGQVPDNLTDFKIEGGWSCLKIEGPLDFALVGILSSIAKPLADASISIFALSTYDTDYVLIK